MLENAKTGSQSLKQSRSKDVASYEEAFWVLSVQKLKEKFVADNEKQNRVKSKLKIKRFCKTSYISNLLFTSYFYLIIINNM